MVNRNKALGLLLILIGTYFDCLICWSWFLIPGCVFAYFVMTIPSDVKTKIMKLTTLTPPNDLRQDIKLILSRLKGCEHEEEVIEDVGTIDQDVENQAETKTKVYPPYPARKPANYNCSADPQCPPGCDVCCKLPYHVVNGTLYVHHFFTKSGLWKVDNRQAW